MTNKNYNRGRNFEYRIRRFLESRGYLCFRSAGSHSMADIIAFRKWPSGTPDVMLIQAKYNTGRITNQEILDMCHAAHKYKFIPVLCTAKPRGKLVFVNFETKEILKID